MTARKQEANGQSSTPGRSFGPTPGRRQGKRKRLAAKAAVAAAKLKVAAGDVVHVSDVTDVAMVNTVAEKVDTISTSKIVAEYETFTLVSPRRGRSVRKPSSLKQKTS